MIVRSAKTSSRVRSGKTVALAAALAAYGLSAWVMGLASEECVDTLFSMHQLGTGCVRLGG